MKAMVWAALPSDLADCCLRDLDAAEAAVLLVLCVAAAEPSALALASAPVLEVDEKAAVVAAG
jgi:hypothetical protein